MILAGLKWSCTNGRPFKRTGDTYRLSFDDCKIRFGSVGKAFEYWAGSKHCKEALEHRDGKTTWTEHGKDDGWQTCIASKLKLPLILKTSNDIFPLLLSHT